MRQIRIVFENMVPCPLTLVTRGDAESLSDRLAFGARWVYHRHDEGQSRKFTLGPVALGSVDEAERDCMKVWDGMQSGERAEDANGAQAPLFRDFVAGSWRAACYGPGKPSTKTSKDWALFEIRCP